MSKLFLLSADEAGKLPRKIRKYEYWWWLRSPGIDTDYAALVFYYGLVFLDGYSVSIDYGAVRPALYLKAPINELNLGRTKKGYVELGMKPSNKPMKWHDISEYMGRPCLLAKSFTGCHRFDGKSNDYATSEIKQYLDDTLAYTMFTDEELDMMADWQG